MNQLSPRPDPEINLQHREIRIFPPPPFPSLGGAVAGGASRAPRPDHRGLRGPPRTPPRAAGPGAGLRGPLGTGGPPGGALGVPAGGPGTGFQLDKIIIFTHLKSIPIGS